MTSRRTGGAPWTHVDEAKPEVLENGFSADLEVIVNGGRIVQCVYSIQENQDRFWIRGQVPYLRAYSPLMWRYVYFTPARKSDAASNAG